MDGALELVATVMRRGGPVMWPIALCSLLVVLVVLRKALQWAFHAFARRIGAVGWARALDALRAGDRAAARGLAAKAVSPYGPILAAALGRDDQPFAEALEAEARAALRGLACGLGVLDTIVTLAPMLGILGTVTGIIASFDLMGSMGADDPTGVAGGIAEALITTAAGLVVSIGALIPLNAGRVWHRAQIRAMEAAMSAAERAAGAAP